MKTMKQNQKDVMRYTLFTKKGEVMTFYIEAVVELYQQIKGGFIVIEGSEYKEIA